MVAEVFSEPRNDVATRATESEPEHETQPVQSVTEGRPLVSIRGVMRGEDLELRNALVGVVRGDDVKVERAVARTILAEKAEIQRGGAQLLLSGGDVSVHQAGAQAIVAAGSVSLVQSGTGIAIGRSIEVGERGTVVFAVAPSVRALGGRVLFGPLPTLAVLAGIAAVVVAVRRFVLRRR